MNKIFKILRLRSRFTGYCKFCAGNLVDDGSTDDSLKIAFDYAQKYSFIYFIHYQNKGVGAARIYLFLDPDDNLALNNAFNLAKQYDVVAVKGQFTNYNEQEPQIVYYNSSANEQVNQNTIQPLHTFWEKH